jgi:hypothetical protein
MPQTLQSLARLLGRALGTYALLLCAFVLCVQAQTDGAAQGAITGQVIDDGGQPIANAQVFISNLRRGTRAASNLEGRFSFPDLARGAYSISASAPGYFDATALAANERAERRYYQPGESVTIRLSKGGVITGRVTDAGGEPLTVTRVFAIRLRALDDQSPGNSPGFARAIERATDDRGVYRFYGLLPGVYLIGAGGRGVTGLTFPLSAHDEDVPTFYPSTTRDGATEIVVRAGQEVGDIDIRHRDEPGHAVSGHIDNAGTGEGYGSILLSIIPADLNYVIAGRFLTRFDGNLSFVFAGLADGDYDLMAEQAGGSGGRNMAVSQRVSVRGADVTGLKLVLAPLAALNGRVVLEAAPAVAPWKEQCQTKLDAVMSEIMINARRAQEPRAAAAQPPGARAAAAAPDDKGEFALRGLAAGRFHLRLHPPGPDWYVRAGALAAAKPDNARASAGAITLPAKTPTRAAETNPLTDWLTLTAGTQLNGLTFTLAPGAAALSGHVAAATTGAALPELQVYLVPVERERADDPLRYATTRVRNDGTFAFNNLAPGRYHLIARPANAHAPVDDSFVAFPDADTRAQLRRATEATDALELQPCQRRDDYVLRYTPK